MDVQKILEKERKLLRTIKHHLPLLFNSNNYIIPQNIDELKAVDTFSPHLVINNLWYYPKDKTKNALLEIAEGMYQLTEVNNISSFDTVYQSIISTIENLIVSGNECDENEFARVTLSLITESIQERISYQELAGIELVDINRIDLGVCEILSHKEFKNEIGRYKEQNNGYYETITEFIRNNFDDLPVIKASGSGDEEIEEKAHLSKYQKAISLLRYIACLLYELGFYKENISIDLKIRKHPGDGYAVYLDQETKILGMRMFTTEPQTIPISKSALTKIHKEYHFGDLLEVLNLDVHTEIEDTIQSCLVWIGEGQNERNLDSSFIKYWTVLEAPFSIYEDNITERIARGITNLFANNKSRIIAEDKKESTYKRIKQLYKLRSKILHRGMREVVTLNDLYDITTYSLRVILALLLQRRCDVITLKGLHESIGMNEEE